MREVVAPAIIDIATSGQRNPERILRYARFNAAELMSTRLRGDGQVVVVPFNTYAIEVAPAFSREGGGYFICDTNDGGRYKWVDPEAELAAIDASDRPHNSNVRKLAQIFKQWQRHCDVPIKSFQLEALVKEALPTLGYGWRDEYWFDWLVRDVLAHMLTRVNGYFTMPVTGEVILLGDAWLSKVQTAYDQALKACNYEYYDCDQAAGDEWQKIFGEMIPLTVT
jgi:Second Messenger Oligonucleotide or Dinucleotide Synthetase domain